MKKIMINCLLTFTLVFILTGCYNNRKVVSRNEIKNSSDGFYVLKNDNNCYSLYNPINDVSNTDILKKALSGNETIFMIYEDNLENIPVLNKEDQLILKQSNNVDDLFPFISLIDYGYSVGIIFNEESTLNNFGFSSISNNFAKNSSAEELIKKQINNINSVKVLNFGEQVLSHNLLSNVNTIKGLIKDNKYEISILEGTNEIREEIVADTKILVSNPKEVFSLKNKQYTDQGYIILNFEEDIPSGYYYLEFLNNRNNGGIFYYENS